MVSIIVALFVSSEKETPPDSTWELNSIYDKLVDDLTKSSVDNMDEISDGVKNARTTKNLVGKQFSGDEFSNENKFELVLQGKLQLVSLRYIPESFSYSSDDTYYGVEVEFCKLDYNLHNEDPSEGEKVFKKSRIFLFSLLIYYCSKRDVSKLLLLRILCLFLFFLRLGKHRQCSIFMNYPITVPKTHTNLISRALRLPLVTTTANQAPPHTR
jgi:hypothetical protein